MESSPAIEPKNTGSSQDEISSWAVLPSVEALDKLIAYCNPLGKFQTPQSY